MSFHSDVISTLIKDQAHFLVDTISLFHGNRTSRSSFSSLEDAVIFARAKSVWVQVDDLDMWSGHERHIIMKVLVEA